MAVFFRPPASVCCYYKTRDRGVGHHGFQNGQPPGEDDLPVVHHDSIERFIAFHGVGEQCVDIYIQTAGEPGQHRGIGQSATVFPSVHRRARHIKYFADGQFSMIEPYLETSISHEPGTREPLLWDEAHMEASMALANKEGFNIHTHAMGSYAIRRVIDCYENAQKLYSNPNIRNIIAHDTFIVPEDRVRMGKSHIIASNQPAWFNDNPTEEPIMVAVWGEEVVRQTYPSKSLIDDGVVCAYGSDFFVSPSYGLAGIQVAMTRRHVKLDPTYELFKDLPAALPEECVSLREALHAHTINAAYQAHLEDITGSIDVGKFAELVVLDSDIETIPVEQIQDIVVLETVFMGKMVFKKN